MLTETTEAKGALFTLKPETRRVNGPVMTGIFEIDAERIEIAAFKRISRGTNLEFLNLRIGKSGTEAKPLYGKLFRNDQKKSEKSPDYSGYVDLGSDENAPQLRIAGWRTRSNDGKTLYISLDLSPPLPQGESSDATSADALPL